MVAQPASQEVTHENVGSNGRFSRVLRLQALLGMRKAARRLSGDRAHVMVKVHEMAVTSINYVPKGYA